MPTCRTILLMIFQVDGLSFIIRTILNAHKVRVGNVAKCSFKSHDILVCRIYNL